MTKNNPKIAIIGLDYLGHQLAVEFGKKYKVVDVCNELKTYNTHVDVYDPWANKMEVKQEYEILLIENISRNKYAALVLAVAHKEFQNIDFTKLSSEKVVIYDTKAFIQKDLVDGRL